MNHYEVTFQNGSIIAMVSHHTNSVELTPRPGLIVSDDHTTVGCRITTVITCSASFSDAQEDAMTAYALYNLERIFY